MKKMVLFFAVLLFSLTFASAIVVNSVEVDSVAPGKETTLRVQIKNTLDADTQDVSFSLQTAGTPFITIGGSEESVKEILSDDEETFAFQLKVSSGAKPGDYSVPYTISYREDGETIKQTRQGTIGVTVYAQPVLSFTASADTPVIGQKSKITLKIVNNGLADAKFVSVKILPTGYTLLSDSDLYVGTVSSDDFEIVSVDGIFSTDNPKLSALVSYKDFDNKEISTSIALPMTVYTYDRAVELGLVKKSYVIYYVFALVLVVVLWFIWRTIRKRRRIKASLNGG